MTDQAQKEWFDEFHKIINYFETFGLKDECTVCGQTGLIPFSEPAEQETRVEYVSSEGKKTMRLASIILLCSRCGFVRKHARTAIDLAMSKSETTTTTEAHDG